MDSEHKKILALFLLAISPPIVLLIIYGDYNLLKYDTFLFFETFNKWPWFKISVFSTIITTLSAHASFDEDNMEKWVVSFIYCLIIVTVVLLLLYPGTQELGLYSDPNLAFAIFLIALLHTFGFELIVSAKKEQSLARKN